MSSFADPNGYSYQAPVIHFYTLVVRLPVLNHDNQNFIYGKEFLGVLEENLPSLGFVNSLPRGSLISSSILALYYGKV